MIFSHIIDRFQLKFKDREAAGNILGESLENLINKKERKNYVYVCANSEINANC